ncbi:MAG: hypothetical protein HOP32_16715 [Nitrospira sp.]|nr:hypothetical protein [Nitrospira sp.]
MKRSILGRAKLKFAGQFPLGKAVQIWLFSLCALLLCNLQPAFAHVSFSNAGTFNGTDLTYSNTLTQ